MRRVLGSSTRVACVSALVCAIAVTAVFAPGLAAGLAPFFTLIAFLVAGLFPGEQIIERLRAQRREHTPARPANAPSGRRAPVPRRVGRAVAFALAMRPPPAALALR